MKPETHNGLILDLIKSDDAYPQIHRCFTQMKFVNARDYFDPRVNYHQAFFACPEYVDKDVQARVAYQQILRGEFGDQPRSEVGQDRFFSYGSVCRSSRRKLFEAHLDILVKENENDDALFATLLDLWISALIHTLRTDHYGRSRSSYVAVNRVLNFETKFAFHPSSRTIVDYQPLPLDPTLRPGADFVQTASRWFASTLVGAIGMTLQYETTMFAMVPVYLGNFADRIPSFLDDPQFQSFAQNLASETRAQRDAERLEREASCKAAHDTRLAVVGKKYRDGIAANSIAWSSMTSEKMAELVWQYPTSTVAVMCGVSDVAIAKYCKTRGIEKPGRGYWAKRGR